MDTSRLDRLDHLRFIAASGVALWHFNSNVSTQIPEIPVLSILQQGHTGVSLFCVISGFIFTWLYLDRDFSVVEYATKRALRIYPLFLLIVFVSFYTASAPDLRLIVISIITTIYQEGSLPGYSSVGWSVFVEIQFYIMFPFIAMFTRRYGAVYPLLLIGLFLSIRYAIYTKFGTVHVLSYLTVIGRLDQFMCGMLAAMLMLRAQRQTKAQILFLAYGFMGLVAIVGFYWWFNLKYGGFNGPTTNNGRIWIHLPLIEGIFYSAIVLGYLSIPTMQGRLASLVNIAMRHGGRISYSIYLTHLMVIPYVQTLLFQRGITPPPTWEAQSICFLWSTLPLLVVVSSFTYFTIEKPMIELGKLRY